MKNFRILALFAFVTALSFTACKNEGSAAKDAARESLATTATTTPAATPSATPAAPAAPVGPLTSLQFEEGIEKTVKWYLDNKDWLNSITSGDYQKYYKEMYHN